MTQRKPTTEPNLAPSAAEDPTLHRSGAVARMLGMPVATLRVWERRYGLTQPALSPSGQRLYSAQDVRRLAVIKQLTELGHAIGSLAPLDMSQLQRVASTHANVRAITEPKVRPEAAPAQSLTAWQVAVVGASLGKRLERPTLLRQLRRPVSLLGPFASVVEAAAALQGLSVQALLIHEPSLQPGWLATADAAWPAFASLPKGVLYGFGADSVCEELASAGIALLREPQPDAVVGQWLRHLSVTPATTRLTADEITPVAQPAPPRRWDDAALAEFADLSTTMACECPRHVAELLMQLSHFEAYSADCEQRSPADAELHAHLNQVAAASRARFEAALEAVALHEGLLLPSTGSLRPASRHPPAR